MINLKQVLSENQFKQVEIEDDTTYSKKDSLFGINTYYFTKSNDIHKKFLMQQKRFIQQYRKDNKEEVSHKYDMDSPELNRYILNLTKIKYEYMTIKLLEILEKSIDISLSEYKNKKSFLEKELEQFKNCNKEYTPIFEIRDPINIDDQYDIFSIDVKQGFQNIINFEDRNFKDLGFFHSKYVLPQNIFLKGLQKSHSNRWIFKKSVISTLYNDGLTLELDTKKNVTIGKAADIFSSSLSRYSHYLEKMKDYLYKTKNDMDKYIHDSEIYSNPSVILDKRSVDIYRSFINDYTFLVIIISAIVRFHINTFLTNINNIKDMISEMKIIQKFDKE